MATSQNSSADAEQARAPPGGPPPGVIAALHAAMTGTNDAYGDALVIHWDREKRALADTPPLTPRDFTRKLAGFVRHLVHAQPELEPGVARSAALLLADAITLETGPISPPALPAEAFEPDDYTSDAA